MRKLLFAANALLLFCASDASKNTVATIDRVPISKLHASIEHWNITSTPGAIRSADAYYMEGNLLKTFSCSKANMKPY
ncbi:hypothetical protein FACS1894126_5590 [Alphaproteobacteria bacterium]|nr:hypothetical protein FACS1894126_5590 [Alphaproteobacteria bacterium]